MPTENKMQSSNPYRPPAAIEDEPIESEPDYGLKQETDHSEISWTLFFHSVGIAFMACIFLLSVVSVAVRVFF